MISGVVSYSLTDCITTICFRIKIEPNTQRQYNRFKNHLRENLGIEYIQGLYGRTSLVGEKFHVNAVNTEKYFHIIVTLHNEIRPEFMKAMAFFDAIKKTT